MKEGKNTDLNFIQLQYRFFIFILQVPPVFPSLSSFCVCKEQEGTLSYFEAVLCSWRLCLQNSFKFIFTRKGNEKEKKKKKIFLDRVLCLVGLGTGSGSQTAYHKRMGHEGQIVLGVQNPSTQTPRPLSASVRLTNIIWKKKSYIQMI